MNINNIKAPESLKIRTLYLMNNQSTCKKKVNKKHLKIALSVACILISLTFCAFTYNYFSGLKGDQLKLSSEYKSNGLVEISITNLSNKNLKLQNEIKLMKFSTAEEIPLINNKKPKIKMPLIKPNGTSIIKLDLSETYNINELEKPLKSGDYYYFVLTNNNFIFGHDFHCSIHFSSTTIDDPKQSNQFIVNKKLTNDIEQELKFYFTEDFSNPTVQDNKYINEYNKLFSNLNCPVIKSVKPSNLVIEQKDDVVFDENYPDDEQDQLWNLAYRGYDYNQRMIATEGEKSLIISAFIESNLYPDSFEAIPIIYILSYEKDSISSLNDYAFIYGKLIKFEDLSKMKVYEDDKYVCYNIGSYIYCNDDLNNYIEKHFSCNENTKKRINKIYEYFNNNLPNLFKYKDYRKK